MTPFEKAKNEAAEKFTEWFAKNYPGPETVIYDPYWHAPRIFSKAIGAMQMVAKNEVEELVKALMAIHEGPELPLTQEMLSAKARAEYVAMFSQRVAKNALAKFKEGKGGM